MGGVFVLCSLPKFCDKCVVFIEHRILEYNKQIGFPASQSEERGLGVEA